MAGSPGKLRLDKWLWQARFFKTRSLSAKAVASGRCRVNGLAAAKPAQAVAVGDVLTFPQARQVRVVRILALCQRRGPAPEARALYDDLDPPEARPPAAEMAPVPRYEGKGRPTKRDRRALEKSRSDALE